jgi:NAD(P)-dependent dehydrogenase (short-subunit alcohol dehydrogenase family)
MTRVAVVTGATGALGSAVVRAFAEQGYEVHGTSSPKEAAPPALDGAARLHLINLLDLGATRELARQFATVQALVLCAGGFSMAALGSLNNDDIEGMMGVNFKTAVHALSAFTPKLGAGSAVVLVGSQAYEAAPRMATYAASKAAVVSLARSAAAELKPVGVQVTAVLPDTLDTPAGRRAMPSADFSRWAKPEEVAAVMTWLCSPAARIVSGNAIRVGR